MSGLFAPPEGLWLYSPSGPGEQTALRVREVLAEGRSTFQDYLVVDTEAFGRVLLLDGQIQSCELDEAVYHESLVGPAMVAHPEPRRIAVLGGGEGAILREVLRHPSVESVVMVDIDGEVVEACKASLEPFHRGAFDDPRVALHAADARAWLEERRGAAFDVVVVDLTEPLAGAASCRLFTREFYELLRGFLAPSAVVSLQAGPVRPNMAWAYGRVINTLAAVFDRVAPYTAWVTSFFEEWGFALAGGPDLEVPTPALLDERQASRGIEPRFLDGATFAGLLALSLPLRQAIAQHTEVITDAAPLALIR